MGTFKHRRGGWWRGLALAVVMTSTVSLAQSAPPPPGGGQGLGNGPPPNLPPDVSGSTPARRGKTGGPYWGSFKTDKCTRSGFVQKSAILWGIQGSWEDACYHAGANIDGHVYEHPARCVNTGTAMWGEFDVPSEGCTPKWDGFKADGCRGVGIRQYSSHLVNIKDIDWNDACRQTSAFVNDVFYAQPTRCRTTRIGGQWGEFDVLDPSC